MAARLADHLVTARQQRFVGRAAELALFESALAAPALPFAVLYLFGPGGVGKTMFSTSSPCAGPLPASLIPAGIHLSVHYRCTI